MRRRFGTELPAGGDLVAKAAPEGPAVQAEMRVYSRLVDPSVAIGPDGLAALTDEVDVLTAPALACDQVRLPSGYLDLLQKAVEKGGYERTHAVLALRWLVEHDCIGAEEADRLSQDWADALVRTVEERRAEGDAGGDLAIEAMAMLAYTGHADRIAADWMDDVISAQRLDGAWQQHVSGTDAPSAHATVLALWLLLELSHPGTQPTPWIPDP